FVTLVWAACLTVVCASAAEAARRPASAAAAARNTERFRRLEIIIGSRSGWHERCGRVAGRQCGGEANTFGSDASTHTGPAPAAMPRKVEGAPPSPSDPSPLTPLRRTLATSCAAPLDF